MSSSTDPAVETCLRDGLLAVVPEGSTVESVEPPPVDTPEGATLSTLRFVVTREGHWAVPRDA